MIRRLATLPILLYKGMNSTKNINRRFVHHLEANVLLYFGSPVNSSSTVFYSAVSPTWGDTVISTFSLQTSVLLMGLPSPVL